MQTVKVFRFLKWDHHAGENRLSKRRATLDTITRVRGDAIPETVDDVEASKIDASGFEIPIEDRPACAYCGEPFTANAPPAQTTWSSTPGGRVAELRYHAQCFEQRSTALPMF